MKPAVLSIDTAIESLPAAAVCAEQSPQSPQQHNPQHQSPPQHSSGSPPGELHGVPLPLQSGCLHHASCCRFSAGDQQQ